MVTGELTSDQREERINQLDNLEENIVPLLVATDCLSEGVNLQNYFNAVIHYDLTWNPTRHEQREGRADRFGQSSKIVRTLMLYGEDNPVDGAVLRVILRKAEKIRKELGVAVPLPMNNDKVIDAIMKAILLHGGATTGGIQMPLSPDGVETEVEEVWQVARNRSSRTIFAQRKLAPEDVLPEWSKANLVFGDAEDVKRFVRRSTERLDVRLDIQHGYCRLPVGHLPKPLRDRLSAIGLTDSTKITFNQPAPAGTSHIHRTHPLVATLADHVAEQALDTGKPAVGARCGASFTKGVDIRTVLYLLRIRNHIRVERRGKDRQYALLRSLLAEECLGVAVRDGGSPEVLTDKDERSLLMLEPARNMPDGQKTHFIRRAIETLPNMETDFRNIARERADQLLQDHRRIREASDSRGLRYRVEPAWPIDIIGVYVLMPAASL